MTIIKIIIIIIIIKLVSGGISLPMKIILNRYFFGGNFDIDASMG